MLRNWGGLWGMIGGIGMTDEELLEELVQAAYDTGFYSGRREDGQTHHIAAIHRREQARARLATRLEDRRMNRRTPSRNLAEGEGEQCGGVKL